ncbi:hypothetical protein NFI96_014890 [Prochilodus magdalenae]|nr:hypothetical protein NFI96_014890 [Prochilodus magdalenae]
MRVCNRGAQMLVTTAGAFAAFSLMTIAVGTDYWLYSPGVCRTKGASDNDTSRKNEEVLTHSGLWRQCCMEVLKRFHTILSRTCMFTGVCKNIDHFPEDADYEQDAAEYLLRECTSIYDTYCMSSLSKGKQNGNFTGEAKNLIQF